MMNTNQWENDQLGALWPPVEDETSAALLSTGVGRGQWEMTPNRLLELLDRDQSHYTGSGSGWLDEKAELPLFDEIEDAGAFDSSMVFNRPEELPESPIFAPSSPAFVSGPSSPAKLVKIEEDLLNFLYSFLPLEQQDNAENHNAITDLIPDPAVEENGPGVVLFDLAAQFESAMEDDTASEYPTFLSESTAVRDQDCSLRFGEESIEDCRNPMTTSIVSSGPGRRRSARAKAQPYQVPDKLQPAPSGAGSSLESSDSPPGGKGRGRRAKLPLEDRKLRKKEQNKTAATRYRMKKKAESEQLSTIEQSLEDRNIELRKQHDDLAHEVAYLKKLMQDFGILA